MPAYTYHPAAAGHAADSYLHTSHLHLWPQHPQPRLRTCLVCPAAVAVVSNHMSWADILIQMARYFPAFVARDGTQNLPMIGLIRWGLGDNGTVFKCMIWERQPVMIAAQESVQQAEPAHDRAHQVGAWRRKQCTSWGWQPLVIAAQGTCTAGRNCP
jgi:1-acyl-sn-glycerol-3-phosphate acyltransferase